MVLGIFSLLKILDFVLKMRRHIAFYYCKAFTYKQLSYDVFLQCSLAPFSPMDNIYVHMAEFSINFMQTA